MNIAASRWAWKQFPARPADKLVLLALAYHAEVKTYRAWPSIAALVADTLINRKQVIPALDRLESAGFIQDTGDRMGRTRQVKVYQLMVEQSVSGTIEEYPIGDR